jgi:N-methylhydantoinase A
VFLADGAAGGVQLTRESVVAGVPVSVPMLDIHTVGAGGGSIARFDGGGMLRVGPESAGAEPGPICFGRGAVPTVTDANLVLGRLDLGSFLGGGLALDRERTWRLMEEHKGPLESVEAFAAGIVRVIEAQMEKAIRVISVERGYDPREFTLVPFGGGGPLHACSLARALRIPKVLVPRMPGALSAVGILLADAVRDSSQTVMLPGSALTRVRKSGHGAPSVGEMFEEMERVAAAEFDAEGLQGEAQWSVDLRYRGQGYELNVPYELERPEGAGEAFHVLHRQRYGFSDAQKAIEIVNLRVRMVAKAEAYEPEFREPVAGDGAAAFYAEKDVFFTDGFVKARLFRRDLLVPGDVVPGPAMVTEYTSATVLPPGCVAEVDGFGNLVVAVA